jgi:outer membrane protein assembly factor BamB
MWWGRKRRGALMTSLLYRRGLTVVAFIAGLVALVATLIALIAVVALRLQETASADWTQFGFDARGTRSNPAEAEIQADNVAGMHLLWRSKLPDIADSTPAFLHALRFPDGTERNVLYLTTKSGSLVALDADSGHLLWRKTNPTFDPNKMTTSSPFADPTEGVVYSSGVDGKVHKYDAITGEEKLGGGWPVTVTTMKLSEKQSSALNAANGFLYVTTASFGGDAPPYQGHLVTIDLSNGSTHVFNAICSDQTRLLAPNECRGNGAGIWARPGVVVEPGSGNIWLATGNGPYGAYKGGYAWGDSVLVLSPDGTKLVDSYTPQKPDDLYTQDLDLGSSAPALLPTIPTSKIPDLAAQAGKEGVLRLLNRQDLSGQGGPGHVGGELQTVDAPNHCPVLTQPAVWADPTDGAVWVIVASTCALGGYQVTVSANGTPALGLAWSVGVGMTSPLVAGNVVFAATTGDKEILAVDPHNGHKLWSSRRSQAGGSIGYTHWESPIVVNGRLYCTDENSAIVAYGL